MCVQFPRVRASFPFLSFWVFVFVCLSVCLFVCFILFCFVLFLCCFCCCCCRFVFAHAENARIAESIILPQLQTSKRMLTDSFSEPKMCLRHFFASPSSLATYWAETRIQTFVTLVKIISEQVPISYLSDLLRLNTPSRYFRSPADTRNCVWIFVDWICMCQRICKCSVTQTITGYVC